MDVFGKRNDALNVNGNTVNGKPVDIAITTHGSDWYWAVTAVMAISTFVFMGLAARKPRQQRIFHYLMASITLIGSISYFTMASNLGWTPIAVEFRRSNHVVSGINRQIFYVRYVDRFITSPLMLTALLLTVAMPWPTLLYLVLVDEVMVVSSLVGALVRSNYKWGYFVFSCAALFYIVFVLAFDARKRANALGTEVRRTYLMCAAWMAFLWLLYPIAWGLSEGGNLIAPDSEAAFYGVLDLLSKPVLGGLLIFGHRNIDPARLGLRFHDYTEPDAYAAKRGVVHNNNVTNGPADGGIINGNAAPNEPLTIHGPSNPTPVTV